MKSYFESLTREEIIATIPLDFLFINPKADRLFILLHGFQQSAEIIFKKLKSALPDNTAILAINGLFPLPERKEDRHEVGFAWYLYDDFTDEYLYDQKPAATAVQNLIESLGLTNRPKTIIGYSQGGYFAPFLAERLTQVKHVVGVSCHFLVDELKKPITYKVDGLHGQDDEVVNSKEAKKAHDKLISKGASGKFVNVPNEGHKLTEKLVENLKGILNS